MLDEDCQAKVEEREIVLVFLLSGNHNECLTISSSSFSKPEHSNARCCKRALPGSFLLQGDPARCFRLSEFCDVCFFQQNIKTHCSTLTTLKVTFAFHFSHQAVFDHTILVRGTALANSAQFCPLQRMWTKPQLSSETSIQRLWRQQKTCSSRRWPCLRQCQHGDVSMAKTWI